MNFCYHPLQLNMEFEENSVNILAIENGQDLTRLLEALQGKEGCEEDISIFDTEKEFVFSKVVEMVWNPLMISLHEKKLVNGLYQALAEDMSEEEKALYFNIQRECLDLFERLSRKIDYKIDSKIEIPVSVLLKSYEVCIRVEGTSLLERLMQYMRLSSRFCGHRVFFLYGLRYFLSEAERQEFYKFCFYQKWDILVIEPRFSGQGKNEKCWIIDESHCIIELGINEYSQIL